MLHISTEESFLICQITKHFRKNNLSLIKEECFMTVERHNLNIFLIMESPNKRELIFKVHLKTKRMKWRLANHKTLRMLTCLTSKTSMKKTKIIITMNMMMIGQ